MGRPFLTHGILLHHKHFECSQFVPQQVFHFKRLKLTHTPLDHTLHIMQGNNVCRPLRGRACDKCGGRTPTIVETDPKNNASIVYRHPGCGGPERRGGPREQGPVSGKYQARVQVSSTSEITERKRKYQAQVREAGENQVQGQVSSTISRASKRH